MTDCLMAQQLKKMKKKQLKYLKEALKYCKTAADMGIVESMFSYAYMMSQ